MKANWLIAVSALALAACGHSEAPAEPAVDAPAPPAAEKTNASSTSPLEAALAGEWRAEAARDAFRHPKETLEFFDVAPDETVVEIWPGGGWYTQILGPYLKAGGGKLIAAGFETEGSEYRANAMAKFNETYVSNPELYGDIEVTVLSENSDAIAPAGSVDTVLTFRNVHNWMSGGYADAVFKQAYDALKPGGVLGVVEHRLPSNAEQDPAASSGYVHEGYIIALAKKAGFEFDGSSEINANPDDTADHPFGVWTLPPVSRSENSEGETPEGFDPEKYKTIGESDRMTLKFIKPAAPAEPAETAEDE